MWSRLLAPATNRAAAFCITCTFAVVHYLQQPAHCYGNQVDCWQKPGWVSTASPPTSRKVHLELSHVERAQPTESSDMVGHGEFTVDKNAQVIDNSWKLYCTWHSISAPWLYRADTVYPLTIDLSFVVIHFQTISSHPVADIHDAAVEMLLLLVLSSSSSSSSSSCDNSLVTDEAEVRRAILSFPAGSAGGPNGLRPQHIRDLVLCRESGPSCFQLLLALSTWSFQENAHQRSLPSFWRSTPSTEQEVRGHPPDCSWLHTQTSCV